MVDYNCIFHCLDVSELVGKIDELAKRLNDTTKMLLQSMELVNDDCRAVVVNQTEFVVNKVSFLIALSELKTYGYYLSHALSIAKIYYTNGSFKTC